MFTGLVEETASVKNFVRTESGARLTLAPPSFAAEMKLGDSLALNGCCLTVAAMGTEGSLHFDLLGETLHRTNLKHCAPGVLVNLERPLRADSRLGGHFVQGHIDTTVPVLATSRAGEDLLVRFALPPDGRPYTVHKGSIAVNGVSLTIANLGADWFEVWLIPHTQRITNLGKLKPGDEVNLEYDILAKHIARLYELTRPQ